jgi:small subunit ribosomal protein S20
VDLHAEELVASHASALKAHRQNVVRRERNRQLRARLRGALKAIRTAVDKNDFTAVKDQLKATVSLVDRMASKGIIHKNAAARYKSRLAGRVVKATSKKTA